MDKNLKDDYTGYEEKDFICDPFFQEWVIHKNQDNNQFWMEFLLLNPGKKEAIEHARTFLLNIKFKEEWPDEKYIQQRFVQHLAQAELAEKTPVIKLNKPALRRFALIAASLTGFLLLTSILFIYTKNRNREVAITTKYGENKTILLSDNSNIVLNAHSRVKFKKNWKANEPREVWLEGEAFFEVKHLNKNEKNILPEERFLVHGKDVTIEVLGTSFNLRQRRGRTEVVLQAGKIVLTLNDNKHSRLVLNPGDLVAYSAANKKMVKTTTEPEKYAAWKEKKLLLNDPTVEEIAGYLEDNFGKKIVIEDSSMANRKIEGPILLNNLDNALFIMSTVLNTTVEKKENIILLRPR
jgi:ferric-dicitrate binding protein FerR (iron transport regulator)